MTSPAQYGLTTKSTHRMNLFYHNQFKLQVLGLICWYFFYCDSNFIPNILTNLCSNGFLNTDNVADIPLLILNSHIDNRTVIRMAIKGRMYLDPPFTELLAYIVGKNKIGPSLIGNRIDGSVKTCRPYSYRLLKIFTSFTDTERG